MAASVWSEGCRPEFRYLVSHLAEGAPGAILPPLAVDSAGALAELAGFHGVRARFATALGAAPPSPLGARVRELLAPAVARETRTALQLSSELLGLLKLLNEARIEAIPYKGPALSVQLYGSPAMRAYRDLDLLLRPGDLRAARELLFDRGYRPLYAMSPEQERAHLAAGYHFNLVRDSDGMLLELHWRVADRYFSDLGEEALLWDSLRELPFLGRSVPALPPETLLLCLAVHGAKHQWDRLSYVCDLAVLLRTEPCDWEQVSAVARKRGVHRRLHVALGLAGELLNASLPALPLAGREARAVADLVTHFAGRLAGSDAAPAGLIAHARVDLGAMDDLRSRWRYLRGVLAPNVSDWDQNPLPPYLAPLQPVLRPFRLLRRYGLLARARREE